MYMLSSVAVNPPSKLTEVPAASPESEAVRSNWGNAAESASSPWNEPESDASPLPDWVPSTEPSSVMSIVPLETCSSLPNVSLRTCSGSSSPPSSPPQATRTTGAIRTSIESRKSFRIRVKVGCLPRRVSCLEPRGRLAPARTATVAPDAITEDDPLYRQRGRRQDQRGRCDGPPMLGRRHAHGCPVDRSRA